ncbi:hypothetical protein [Acinetobacter tandoii]|uniref:Uncharacterized protein n=2 Tax=Acinetobacter tandoii TaxID=202954 RepID=R9AXB2_9GAMM|nr:hypothetical protein [Acinetobacter tandoii]EOR06827.1 hypothetical protein I593_01694 [Acinetobacter tandoii DSM 14970 = CIP 107469]
MNNQITQYDIRFLIATLRALYASQFNKNFPTEGVNAFPLSMVEGIVGNALTGVTKQQFDRGIVLLSTSGKKYMPSFAEFKELCVGQDWWNAQKAWVKACEYTKIMHHKKTKLADNREQYQEITTIAKFALDQVMLLITDGEMYEAKREFIRLYEEYLAEAQLKGRVQEWYQEPAQLTWNNEKKEHVPVEKEDARLTLENLKKKLNVRNRHVVKPQELKPTEKSQQVKQELGPDPFDNLEAYAEMCRRDGVPVPRDIAALVGGGV